MRSPLGLDRGAPKLLLFEAVGAAAALDWDFGNIVGTLALAPAPAPPPRGFMLALARFPFRDPYLASAA